MTKYVVCLCVCALVFVGNVCLADPCGHQGAHLDGTIGRGQMNMYFLSRCRVYAFC